MPWTSRVGAPALWLVALALATALCAGGVELPAAALLVVASIALVYLHENLGWRALAPRVEEGDLVLAGERVPVAGVREVRSTVVWSSDDDSVWLYGISVEGERPVIVQTASADQADVVEAACRDLLGLPDPTDQPVVLAVYAEGWLRPEPLLVFDGPRPAGLEVERRGSGLRVRVAGTRLTAGEQAMDVLDIERVDAGSLGDPSRPAVLLQSRDGRRWYLAVARRASAVELARGIEAEIARLRGDRDASRSQRAALRGAVRA